MGSGDGVVVPGKVLAPIASVKTFEVLADGELRTVPGQVVGLPTSPVAVSVIVQLRHALGDSS